MTFEQLGILLIGFGFILLIYWFFFGETEVVAASGSVITITADAGYSPSVISLQKNQPAILKILRTDPSDCLEQLIIPQFNISKTLPLDKEVTITITPTQTGEFPFHCGMNMFHGSIIVT